MHPYGYVVSTFVQTCILSFLFYFLQTRKVKENIIVRIEALFGSLQIAYKYVHGNEADFVQETLEEELKDQRGKRILRYIRIYYGNSTNALVDMPCVVGVVLSENKREDLTELESRLAVQGYRIHDLPEMSGIIGSVEAKRPSRMANYVSSRQTLKAISKEVKGEVSNYGPYMALYCGEEVCYFRPTNDIKGYYVREARLDDRVTDAPH